MSVYVDKRRETTKKKHPPTTPSLLCPVLRVLSYYPRQRPLLIVPSSRSGLFGWRPERPSTSPLLSRPPRSPPSPDTIVESKELGRGLGPFSVPLGVSPEGAEGKVEGRWQSDLRRRTSTSDITDDNNGVGIPGGGKRSVRSFPRS